MSLFSSLGYWGTPFSFFLLPRPSFSPSRTFSWQEEEHKRSTTNKERTASGYFGPGSELRLRKRERERERKVSSNRCRFSTQVSIPTPTLELVLSLSLTLSSSLLFFSHSFFPFLSFSPSSLKQASNEGEALTLYLPFPYLLLLPEPHT